ncbi:MAG: FeoB-associated Cys-rich membrane protein [Lachnospiraceae bacterium]|nr:FeoB-associated Cys-rich membrane protein [Lachnospiraceae bacterium]MCR5023163.1 FeoB-associated Cys-rich membrane protein [Lachnospiraceae bacterium]MCR5023777.1 FeoB-associated Cys-rich membrane protein [Lachnospiraceae bacterium]
MPAVLGNAIAILLVCGLVFLCMRSILKSSKKGSCGCGENCSCCSGGCNKK